MDQLNTVFEETEEVKGKDRKLLSIRTINEFAARTTVNWKEDDSIRTDGLLRNTEARITYETFIGVCSDDGKATSIMWIARVDSWMTCVMEDPKCRLKDVGRKGEDRHALKTRYNALIPFAIAKIRQEFMSWLRLALSTN